MPSIELSAEQLQLVKIVNDHALRFPNTEIGEADLLQSCYDYMNAFKRVMDSTSRIQMDYIFQQYDGVLSIRQVDGEAGSRYCRWHHRRS